MKIMPKHIALCQKPGVDGADIIAMKKGDQVYVKQSQFNTKPMSTAAADQPGVNRSVVDAAADPISALKAELEAERATSAKKEAEIARREAELKAKSDTMSAKEKDAKLARIKDLKSQLTDATNAFVAESAASKEEALGASADLFDLAERPDQYPNLVRVFASAGRQYGNVKAVNADLKSKLGEALATIDNLKTRVTESSRTMTNDDRWPPQTTSTDERAAYMARVGAQIGVPQPAMAPTGATVTLNASANEIDERAEWIRGMKATLDQYTGSNLLVNGSADELEERSKRHRRG